MKLTKDKTAGESLKEFRSYYGITQAELAECLDISLRTVQNWELRGMPFSTFKMIRGLFYMASFTVQYENRDETLSNEEIKRKVCYVVKSTLEC